MVTDAAPLHSQPLVEVSIDGHVLHALLDTGAPVTELFADAALRIGLKPSDLVSDKRFMAGGVGLGVRLAVKHKLASVTVGEVTIQNMPVAVVDQAAIHGVDMILGMDFMSQMRVWFSFSSGKVLFEYPPKPAATPAVGG